MGLRVDRDLVIGMTLAEVRSARRKPAMSGAERALRYRQRKVAEGLRRAHNGCFTDEPLRIARRGEAPPHGTNRRYISKAFGCRCQACLDARTEYVRTLRQGQR
jgi:hypothetical protein